MRGFCEKPQSSRSLDRMLYSVVRVVQQRLCQSVSWSATGSSTPTAISSPTAVGNYLRLSVIFADKAWRQQDIHCRGDQCERHNSELERSRGFSWRIDYGCWRLHGLSHRRYVSCNCDIKS